MKKFIAVLLVALVASFGFAANFSVGTQYQHHNLSVVADAYIPLGNDVDLTVGALYNPPLLDRVGHEIDATAGLQWTIARYEATDLRLAARAYTTVFDETGFAYDNVYDVGLGFVLVDNAGARLEAGVRTLNGPGDDIFNTYLFYTGFSLGF